MTRLVADPVRVHVPATSANLGPGFDALGLALGLGDDVVAAARGDGLRIEVEGEGAGEVPLDERHLVARVLLATLRRLGAEPTGLHLRCTNRIPHARGLGSSAAAIVAGLLAARALVDDGPERLPDGDLLELAAAEEGHPDNVAACLLGGLTLAWTSSDGTARAVRLPVSPALRPVVFVPGTTSSTAKARRALPATVPHADAARNAGRSALLVHALAADPELLFTATEDRLHQQYRATAQPRTAGLVEALRADGVAAVVSGAGPSVLAFAGPADDLSSYLPRGWSVEVPAVDRGGAEQLALAG